LAASSWRPITAELPLGEEVVHVKYFKITKSWVVKVEDTATEADAIKLVAAEPEKYLDSETVTRTEYKNPQTKTGGWKNGFKSQLLGH
jgi:hypothetical protein